MLAPSKPAFRSFPFPILRSAQDPILDPPLPLLMASSDTANRREGKDVVMEEEEEEDDNLDELEGFDDFTLASSWERFISEIEAVCRQWLLDGPKNLMEKGAECLGSPKNLYKVKCELKNGMKSYSVEHYFEICSNDKAQEWDDDVHNLQLSFGVHDFLVIAPLSASGVVLDSPESCKLLSAVAIALSNCGSNWPAFVPVHDPSRKAYIGIQNMGTIFTRRFDADRIGSQVPIKLMHMEGLYELFVSKFALYPSDFSTSSFKVHFSMKLTYRTPPFDDEDDTVENMEHEFKDVGGDADNLTRIKPQWDDDCPWAEWYSAEDPVKGFELIAIWSSKIYEDSLEMAELENASSLDAEKWLIYPIITQNLIDDSPRKLIGFASQLNLLVSALDMSFQAQFLEDFVSAEKQGSDNSKSAVAIPPPSVLDRVLKELFHDGNQISSFPKFEDTNSRAIKGAPLRSPFTQFCLQSLWFGNCNIRAIAALWIEFVREVRWCWEESQPLPGVSTDSSIDLSACLLHQKLQMLAVCIRKKSLLDHDNDKSNGRQDHKSSSKKEDFQAESNQCPHRSYKEHLDDRHNSSLRSDGCYSLERTVTSSDVDRENADTFPDPQPSNTMRMGSAGVIGSMMLLHSFQKMHAPYTQDPPIMTEDMHEERLQAVQAFGDAFSFSGQLERDILSSDMSAFKAANPDAVFEDFIRWHSPGDWESSETEVRFEDQNTELQGCNWPPQGRLSERMSEHGNSWRQIWNDSPPVRASEQKPLFDPIREGEKVLHYMETLRPHQLLEQMICTAFKAAADTLNLTSYGGFNLMKTKLSQLYLTIASTLKPLQGNHLLDKAELSGDLKRLCHVFEHIEKLLILAASIHRKLLDAPRLSEAVFNDYFNFYLPKMGNSLTSMCYNKKFSNKQQVNMHERDAVANLFTPPTANQSWRKVLSMGNLLNGHEPILREIIFRAFDRLNSGHYGISDLCFPTEEIETNRMYICGTSNDLRVALSVTSWD